ncbi:MAG: glycosyltransferase [Lachnospiraceae bacterium]|nr:glycosyltransferase [Lachnospiraceae bacterium]
MTENKKELISIIIPCYNEEDGLDNFFIELQKATEQIANTEKEFWFIDDGSIDKTLQIIKEFVEKDKRVRYISFSRNFGKEAAIQAGMEHAKGNYVVIIDADLQDPPELLPDMYREVKENGYDSAAARRVNRKGEPRIRSFFSCLFYKIMRKMTGVEIADGARDYRLMNRKFTDAVLRLSEYNRFSKGLFAWVGFRTKWVEYENVTRAAGESKWTFFALLKYAISGIVTFTTVPLVISSFMGIIFCAVAFLAVVFIIVRKCLFGDPVAGWASLACIMTFLSGIQFLVMGIFGQYLAKMYLEIKARPLYLVREMSADSKLCE